MPEFLKRWKTYWQISQAGEIIRRYFAMNFFDGILTALGIILGSYLSTLDGSPPTRESIVTIALATAIAIGISGLTGSHLAESAERKLKVLEMKQVLGLSDEEDKDGTHSVEKHEWTEKDLRLALGKFENMPILPQRNKAFYSLQLGMKPEQKELLLKKASSREKDYSTAEKNVDTNSESELDSNIDIKDSRNFEAKISNNHYTDEDYNANDDEKESLENKLTKNNNLQSSNNKPINAIKKKISIHRDEKERDSTLFENAQQFASRIAAVIDGLSPFAGVILVVLPFLFPISLYPTMAQFYLSFAITIVVLFALGGYLAYISKESIIKFGVLMVLSALLTSTLTVFINSLNN